MMPNNYRLDNRVENEVISTPDVQCSEDAITFSVRTAAPFRFVLLGRVREAEHVDRHCVSTQLQNCGKFPLFTEICGKNLSFSCKFVKFPMRPYHYDYRTLRYWLISRGNIYVKGHYGIELCRQEYYGNDFAGATFVVQIGDCGMRRIRQVSNGLEQ